MWRPSNLLPSAETCFFFCNICYIYILILYKFISVKMIVCIVINLYVYVHIYIFIHNRYINIKIYNNSI